MKQIAVESTCGIWWIREVEDDVWEELPDEQMVQVPLCSVPMKVLKLRERTTLCVGSTPNERCFQTFEGGHVV